MDTQRITTKGLWILTAAGLIAFAGSGARAQTSGAAGNGDAALQSTSGPNRNRDAGERDRRGPGGGRFGGRDRSERGGRGGESGNRDNSSASNSSSSTPAAKAPPTPATPELSDAERARAWAKEIIKKNDKNGDGLLQESEQEELGTISEGRHERRSCDHDGRAGGVRLAEAGVGARQQFECGCARGVSEWTIEQRREDSKRRRRCRIERQDREGFVARHDRRRSRRRRTQNLIGSRRRRSGCQRGCRVGLRRRMPTATGKSR